MTTIVEQSHVRIIEPGHEHHGRSGIVLYLPSIDGPWYEIQLDNEPPHTIAVVRDSTGLESTHIQ